MKFPGGGRLTPAQGGWLLALLLVGWVVFLFFPKPKPPPQPLPPFEVKPPSKLEEAGLRDYTDWQGLPEIFAVWADKADWQENRTRFSYWNPATRAHSYFFEARRTPQGYRFREISEPKEADHEWDPAAAEDSPLRLYLPKKAEAEEASFVRTDTGVPPPRAPTKVELELAPPAPLATPQVPPRNN